MLGAHANHKSQVLKGHNTSLFRLLKLQKQLFKELYRDYVGKSKKRTTGLSEARLKLIGQPNYNSIAVDAASSGNPGIMEYRGVDTQSKKQLFHKGPFDQGTNNIGEFLALVHGLALLKQNKQSTNSLHGL